MALWTRLRTAVWGSPPPAHLRRYAAIPLRVRLGNIIRPPQAPVRPRALNPSQLRLIRTSVTAGAILIAGAGMSLYVNLRQDREARSMELVQEGLKAVAGADYRRAVRQFSDAISAWPENAQAYLHRGNARAILGTLAEARRDWDRAIELDSGLADAYAARGTQYRIEGAYEQAIRELNRSIQLRPSVNAYYQRGQVYAALHDYARAIADFDRSIAELPDAPYVYRARSAARKAIGDLAGANEDRLRADRIEGTLAKAY